MEQIVKIISAYETGGSAGTDSSLVVVIPKKAREYLNITKGDEFIVKIDDRGRLIYEKKAPLKSTDD